MLYLRSVVSDQMKREKERHVTLNQSRSTNHDAHVFLSTLFCLEARATTLRRCMRDGKCREISGKGEVRERGSVVVGNTKKPLLLASL